MADCIAGRLGSLEVSSDGGLTYVRLGLLVDATLNTTTDEIECTSHDSGGVRMYHPNNTEATIDISTRYSDTDTGQSKIIQANFAKTLVRVKFRLQTGSGYRQFESEAFATSLNISSPLDDVSMLDGTLRLSGLSVDFQA